MAMPSTVTPARLLSEGLCSQLQEFYIGELAPEDRLEVPCVETPSPEFLHQLRDFTTWRMPCAKVVQNL